MYFVLKFTTDPYLKAWTEQNRIFSPHPFHAILAYGLMLFPAILGVLHIIRSKRWTGLLLVAWVIAFPAFAYLPHNLQRRLPDGIWIAWIILAALGVHNLGNFARRQSMWRVILMTLSVPTSLMLFISALQVSTHPRIPLHRPAEEVEIFKWLRNEGGKDSVVLSSFHTGNAVPAWAPVTVVLGHGPETANHDHLRSQVAAFYSGEMDREDQFQFLRAQQVDYVFFGPEEREFGEMDFYQSVDFELRMTIGEYQLFEVTFRERDE
jgi:hypothetical protein